MPNFEYDLRAIFVVKLQFLLKFLTCFNIEISKQNSTDFQLKSSIWKECPIFRLRKLIVTCNFVYFFHLGQCFSWRANRQRCDKDEFPCHDCAFKTSWNCMSISKFDDGVIDCSDRSDEISTYFFTLFQQQETFS